MDQLLVEIRYVPNGATTTEYVPCRSKHNADQLLRRFAGRRDVQQIVVYEPRQVCFPQNMNVT